MMTFEQNLKASGCVCFLSEREHLSEQGAWGGWRATGMMSRWGKAGRQQGSTREAAVSAGTQSITIQTRRLVRMKGGAVLNYV